MDEVLSGVRSALAVKIFGSDLEQLLIGQQVNDVTKTVEGIVDLQLEPQVPIEQIQIKFDRAAASRYGLQVGQLSKLLKLHSMGGVSSFRATNLRPHCVVKARRPSKLGYHSQFAG